MRNSTKATKTTKQTSVRNKMNIKTVTRDRLPMCWLYDGKDYVLLAKGGREIERKLPYVDAKYANALSEAGIGCNVVAIPHKYNPDKTYEVCEYYDPNMYEQEELPVYTQLQGSDESYIFTGDVSSHGAVTVETIKRAAALKNKVHYIAAKQDLDGKMGVVKYINIDSKEIDLVGEDGGKIKMLQAYSFETDEDGTEVRKPTKFYGVFDMEQVENNLYIQVVAEEGSVRGTAIGKKGKNKEDWEYLLGGERKIIFV